MVIVTKPNIKAANTVSTEPDDDSDVKNGVPAPDGLTNSEEAQIGTNPINPDSDGDNVTDGKDGWPTVKDISPPRLADTNYAVLDVGTIREDFTYLFSPVTVVLNDLGQVFYYDNPHTGGVDGHLDVLLWDNGQTQTISSRVDLGSYSPFVNWPDRNLDNNSKAWFTVWYGDRWDLTNMWTPDSGESEFTSGPNIAAPSGTEWDGNWSCAITIGSHDGTWLGNATRKTKKRIISDPPKNPPEYEHGSYTATCLWSNGVPTILEDMNTPTAQRRQYTSLGDDGMMSGTKTENSIARGFVKLNGVETILTTGAGSVIQCQAATAALPAWAAGWNGTEAGVWQQKAENDWKFNALAFNPRVTNGRWEILGDGQDEMGNYGQLLRNNRALDLYKNMGSQWSYFTPVDLNNNGLIAGIALKDENNDGQFQEPYYGNGSPDKHHVVLLLPVEVMVDANHDGKMSLTDPAIKGKDANTNDKPFQFWVNDDVDKGHSVDGGDWEEDDLNTGSPDYQDGEINCRRDLEDFTRLWFDAYPVIKVLGGSTGLTVEMEWKPLDNANSVEGNPSIKLYKAVEADGGSKYLTEQDQEGYNQTQGEYKTSIATVSKGSICTLPANFLSDVTETNPCKHLLFEGAGVGKGKLIIRIRKGQTTAELPPLYIELKNVQDMYETWTVGDVPNSGIQYNYWPASTASKTTGQDLPAPNTTQEKDYFLFVHGWNMSSFDKDVFAATAFKRLWLQGYQGRFGAFRWPTFFDPISTDHFDGSEQRAWNSAPPLAGLISQLSQTFQVGGQSKVRLFAHSMGNIVASECLRQTASTPKVHTYVAAQAALSSHVWDNTTPSMPFTVGGSPTGGAPETPDVYGYYWENGAASPPHEWQGEGRKSYMDPQYMPSGVRYINHYNPYDWALSFGCWQINQMLKPDIGYHYGIMNPLDLTDLKKCFWRDQAAKLAFPIDRFEIFSYAAESHSYATGQQGATGGMFGAAVDLNASPFNFGSAHKGHSAQFRSTIQMRSVYWKRLIEDMGISVP